MQQAEDLGLSGYLVKPVSSSSLYNAILEAFGHQSEDAIAVNLTKTADHVRGAHLLLVEDNEINQQVAEEILGQVGIRLTIADNGQIGLDALRESPDAFDGVLMDIQMPVMDGYAATREIRKEERFRDLPIIAMTANAMAGDREKAIAAGMNDHVAKPIDINDLHQVLGQWIFISEERRGTSEAPVSSKQVEESEIPVEQPEPDNAVPAEHELPKSLSGFDLEDGLMRLQGNKKLYRKLLLSFASDYSAVANEICQALDAEDFDQAHSLVHNLKGLAGNLAATELQAAAVNLEKLVKGVEKKTPSVNELNLKYSELEAALNQALESAQRLGAPAEENSGKLSDKDLADIASTLPDDFAKRIRDAAEMGDVTTINAIAEEIKDQSDSCMLLSKQIIQMAEDFDLDGIQKLADDLNSC
jgi:CheY-like chemotaxis protein